MIVMNEISKMIDPIYREILVVGCKMKSRIFAIIFFV